MRAFAIIYVISSIFLTGAEEAMDPERAANTVILTEQAIANLGIETAVAGEQTFDTTVFALGRIADIPSRHSVLSTRIDGRIQSVDVFEGDSVREGETIGRIESRQPGNPPPTLPLVAPRSGLVVSSGIRPGQPVTAAEELMTIVDRSRLWAIARIPEHAAGLLKEGSPARLHIPAAGISGLTATLSRFGLEADREAGTIDGIFEIMNEDGRLQPGMRVEFSLVTGQRENVLSLPRAAIQGDPENRHVFVKDFEIPNAFLKAPVVTGSWNEDTVEIVSGVFPGDEVVTRGSYNLGFAGKGGGPSLKEALDAAHGHKHNEDGSEMTSEQQAEHDHHEEDGHDHGTSPGKLDFAIRVWAVIATVLALFWVQGLFTRRKS